MGLSKVRVFSDSKEVVHAINGGFNWDINPIILDIATLVSEFQYVDFVFIPRNLNVVAYLLAKLSYSMKQDFL